VKPIKILAVSDRVDELIYSPAIEERYGDVDLVLACGDLPLRYLEYIVTKLDVPLLYVLGNHDQGVFTSNGQFKVEAAGCTNIDDKIVEVKGLLIGGLEGSMSYTEGGDHQYSEWDMQRKALRMMPALWANKLRHGRFLDILVTHAPPYRIHDDLDLCHTGFQAFRWFMETYRPRCLVHGHQHLYGPNDTIRTTYCQTEVVNAYGCQVIELDREMPGDGSKAPGGDHV
jgi:Icc-related predicted phosphoesterase